MNKQRRQKIADAVELIEKALEMLDDARHEEQEAFDSLPESFQYGERGEQMEEYIGILEEAYDTIEEYKENLDEIVFS